MRYTKSAHSLELHHLLNGYIIVHPDVSARNVGRFEGAVHGGAAVMKTVCTGDLDLGFRVRVLFRASSALPLLSRGRGGNSILKEGGQRDGLGRA